MDPSLISSQSSYFPSRFSGSRLRGFTLTELLVSLTVLLVLSTIAVATYAQFRDSGEATAAQNVLFELETTQRFWHRDHSTYLYDPLDLEEEVGTHLTFLGPDTSSAAPTEVSVSGPLDSGDTVAMAVLARSGECFVMVLSSVRDPRLVTDSYTTDVDACTGSAAATKVGTNPWGQP